MCALKNIVYSTERFRFEKKARSICQADDVYTRDQFEQIKEKSWKKIFCILFIDFGFHENQKIVFVNKTLT